MTYPSRDGDRSLSGTVLDEDGKPLKGAEVRAFDPTDILNSHTGITDAQGHYVVAHLLNSSFVLAAHREGSIDMESAQEARPGSSPVAFRLKRAPKLEGRIRAQDGTPVPLFLLGENTVETDTADGHFVAPIAECGCSEVAKGGSITIHAPGFLDQSKHLRLIAGQTTSMGDLVLRRGRSVSGIVTDAKTGAPIGDAWLSSVTWKKSPREAGEMAGFSSTTCRTK